MSSNPVLKGDHIEMANKPQTKSQSMKTMLKGQDGSSGGGSVKDQVRQALMKKRGGQSAAPSGGAAPTASPGQPAAPAQGAPAGGAPLGTAPIMTKIENTVDSMNDMHTTMESLNNNMNMFVDLFKQRGQSLGGGGSGTALPGSSGGAGGDATGMGGSPTGFGGGQNAVTSLLLTNLLKKNDTENADRLSDLKLGSRDYLDLLIKRIDKYQHEYELLQYLFEPKMFGGNLQPSSDAQGNSAWLAGFMSMMVNRKK